MASRKAQRRRKQKRRAPSSATSPRSGAASTGAAAREPASSGEDAGSGASRWRRRLAASLSSSWLHIGLVVLVAWWALWSQDAPVDVSLMVAAVTGVLVSVIVTAAGRLGGLLGPVTAWAAVAVLAGLLVALASWAAPSCPGGGGRRCDLAETGLWALNGILLVGIVAITLAVLRAGRRVGRAGGRAGIWLWRKGAHRAGVVARRQDGLFRRPPWRDPLVFIGLGVAVLAVIVSSFTGHGTATGALAAIVGFLMAGILPATWRFAAERPELVAANRNRARRRRWRARRAVTQKPGGKPQSRKSRK